MTQWLMILAAMTGNCGDKASQTAMTMCEKGLADSADTEMNRVWKEVYPAMQRLDRIQPPDAADHQPGFAAALLASQRAWLAFRDAECLIEGYAWRGGSMQPFAENQCAADVTRARTRQLRIMLETTRR